MGEQRLRATRRPGLSLARACTAVALLGWLCPRAAAAHLDVGRLGPLHPRQMPAAAWTSPIGSSPVLTLVSSSGRRRTRVCARALRRRGCDVPCPEGAKGQGRSALQTLEGSIVNRIYGRGSHLLIPNVAAHLWPRTRATAARHGQPRRQFNICGIRGGQLARLDRPDAQVRGLCSQTHRQCAHHLNVSPPRVQALTLQVGANRAPARPDARFSTRGSSNGAR